MALVPKSLETAIKTSLQTELQSQFTNKLESAFRTLFEMSYGQLSSAQKAAVKPQTDKTVAAWKKEITTALTDVLSKVLSEQLSKAIDTYIKTATVTLPSGSIAVVGSPSAQANPAPAIGSPPLGGLS